MQYALNVQTNEGTNAAPCGGSTRKLAHPYHHGDLRNALLSTARTMLAEDPQADLSLRAVARAASVSHAAPYRHFANQNALLVALACEGFSALSCAILDVDTSAGADVRTSGVCRTYFEFVLSHRALARLMFGTQIVERSVYSDLVSASAGLVSAIARGLGRDDVGLSALAVLHGFAALASEKIVDVPESVEALTARSEAILRGLLRE